MTDHTANKTAIHALLQNADPEMKHFTIQLRRAKDGSPYYVVSAHLKNYDTHISTHPVSGNTLHNRVARDGLWLNRALTTQLLYEIQTAYEELGFGIPLNIKTENSNNHY